MNISRQTLKRQIAAARAVIVGIHTRAPNPNMAPSDDQQLLDALDRLEANTEELARQFYRHDSQRSCTLGDA